MTGSKQTQNLAKYVEEMRQRVLKSLLICMPYSLLLSTRTDAQGDASTLYT